MCDICRQSPCDSRCPNAPDPPVAYECIHCDAEIYEGDSYYDIDGEPWCENCIKDAHTDAERSD